MLAALVDSDPLLVFFALPLPPLLDGLGPTAALFTVLRGPAFLPDGTAGLDDFGVLFEWAHFAPVIAVHALHLAGALLDGVLKEIVSIKDGVAGMVGKERCAPDADAGPPSIAQG